MATEVINKKVIFGTALAATLISGVLIFSHSFSANGTISLAEIPYTLTLPHEIASKISATSTSQSGVTETSLYYQPTTGNSVWVASITYTSLAEYDAHAAVNEVPLYGLQLKRENGMSLSVHGAQEAQFPLGSKDNKFEEIINRKIYIPGLYQAK